MTVEGPVTGEWSLTEAPEPANTAADAGGLQNSTLEAARGVSAEACVVVQYQDTTGTGQGLIDTLATATWSGSETPPPGTTGGFESLATVTQSFSLTIS